jgi:hypothetical protein
MKSPFLAKGQLREAHGCPLIFQNPGNHMGLPLLPELAPFRLKGC